MHLTRSVKRMLQARLRGRLLPFFQRGVDADYDIRGWLPNLSIDTIFDVGANLGQSATAYAAAYPNARIFCFEPTPAIFDKLRTNVRSKRVSFWPIALSDKAGTGQISTGNRTGSNFLTDTPADNVESVPLSTVDQFCAEQGVQSISLLKIDTEGHDLSVLKGAAGMLASAAIDVVQVEAGMHPGNDFQVPFEQLKAELERHDYALFGLYEQVGEWPTREPHLRRANPVFISRRVIRANQKAGKSGR